MIDFKSELKTKPIIPYIAINELSKLSPLIDTLMRCGINILEVTFRTSEATKILQYMNEIFPDFLYGAGTVRNLEQLHIAMAQNAKFIFTPGINQNIIDRVKEKGYPNFYPGVDSTSSLELALKNDMKIMKFFPAEVNGGVKWLQEMKGPYFDVQFIPTGGINLENLHSYLELSNVIAVAGDFMLPQNYIAKNNWDGIEDLCLSALDICNDVRNK